MTTSDDARAKPRQAKRRSVWAAFSELPKAQQTPAPSARKKPIVFYVILTNWAGARLAFRYTKGVDFPMAPGFSGGTYMLFTNGMIYVQESQDQINEKILHRLNQMQSNWQAG